MSLKMLLTEQMMITCAIVCKKPKIQSAISSRKTTFSSFLSLFHVQCFSQGHTAFSLHFFFFCILFLQEPHKTNNWWEVHKRIAFTYFRCWRPGVACHVFFFLGKKKKKMFRDWTLLYLKVRVLQMCNGWYSCTYSCTAEIDFKVSEVGIFREYQS